MKVKHSEITQRIILPNTCARLIITKNKELCIEKAMTATDQMTTLRKCIRRENSIHKI